MDREGIYCGPGNKDPYLQGGRRDQGNYGITVSRSEIGASDLPWWNPLIWLRGLKYSCQCETSSEQHSFEVTGTDENGVTDTIVLAGEPLLRVVV